MAKTYVIDNNEARVPFFGDKMSFITGLDPLGLQNPSTKAYSHLLPGLNNVTGQIRCYSFYCWLLGEYAKNIKSTDPKEQKTFIRKAEYIIALISQIGEIPGISGKQYATNQVEKHDTYDLKSGIYNSDGSTTNTYWQYHYGIFGQYYIGSMRQIGIIDEPTNQYGESLGIYRRTNSNSQLKVSGEDLANAFEEELQQFPDAKQLYLDCIDANQINKEQIAKLIPHFNLRSVRLNSTEWFLLKELILSEDEPSDNTDQPKSLRKQTVIHLLKFAKNNPELISDREFTMFAYENKGKIDDKEDECLFGWYYYQLNEYWQVGCTAIFNGCLSLLESLSGPGWKEINELLNESFDLIQKTMQTDNKIGIGSEFQIDQISIDYNERELYKKIIRGTKEDRLTYGLMLVLKVYLNNYKSIVVLDEYANEQGLNNNYDSIAFYKSLNQTNIIPFKIFVNNFLLKNIINRHQVVAYRKMGSGSQSTQKFITEDGLIRQIGNFDPGFTGPRVGNLIIYLKDLKLLSDSGKISKSGEDILKSVA